MVKTIITTEMVNGIAFDEITKTHERKAKTAIKKDRIAELTAQGIDKEIAKVMASVGL